VEALDHQQQRLDLALAEQEAATRLDRLLAALAGVEPLPPGILERAIQQGEEDRQQGQEGVVEREEPVAHLLPHPPSAVTGLQLEVGAEEIAEGEQRRGRPVGDGARVNDQPSARGGRPQELQDEA